MNDDLERFKQALLKSVNQMRRGEARSRTEFSQAQFARLLGV